MNGKLDMLLNEFEIAERILATKKLSNSEDLFIVAKYLRNEMNCNEDEAYTILNNIMAHSNKKYNSNKSVKYLNSVSKKAVNFKLHKVEKVNVTQKELKIISQVDNLKLQRLLFSLLIHAKFRNAISEDNNDWCNVSINHLFKTAKVSTRNAKEKACIINKLKNLGLIGLSVKNTNHNIRCLFVDNSENKDDVIISDLRELGYQYLSLRDDKQFKYCECCGVIIKKKSKWDYSTKYCKDCLSVKNFENRLNSYQK